MGNGISEDLKIKIFWRSMPPDPAKASSPLRLFHYVFLCVPKRKSHATSLILCEFFGLSDYSGLVYTARKLRVVFSYKLNLLRPDIENETLPRAKFLSVNQQQKNEMKTKKY